MNACKIKKLIIRANKTFPWINEILWPLLVFLSYKSLIKILCVPKLNNNNYCFRFSEYSFSKVIGFSDTNNLE